MARTGGRNLWIAVPVTAIVFAVVAALVWLALPMIPVAFAWVGDTLRSATMRAQQGDEQPAVATLDLAAADCRDIYPGDLWAELRYTPGVALAQDASAPPTSVDGLADAVSADVAVTCAWNREAGGSIVTTLSEVGADAADIVPEALRDEGFSCAEADGILECAKRDGRVREEHTLSGRLWLVSLETSWLPRGYGDRLDAWLFG